MSGRLVELDAASYSTVVQSRPWSRLNVESFRSTIVTSKLCQPDTWPLDIDEMAALNFFEESLTDQSYQRLMSIIVCFITSADLPTLQSGFRPGHSTETAVLQVLSDILQVVDRGNSAALVILNLSAAFDTADHEILLQCLRVTFGIHETVHRWFQSYLLGRTQYVRRASQIINNPSDVWCASRVSVGSPVIHFVHRRSDVIDRRQRFFTSSVRCRHSGVRFLSTRRDRCILGEAL